MMWPHESRRPVPSTSARGRRPKVALARLNRHRPNLEPLEGRALMTAGALDPTFNGTGTVLTAINSASGGGHMAVAIQYDSANYLKTVVVATTTIAQRHGSESVYAVARYNPNGTLDSTFGSGGEVDIPVTAGSTAPVVQAQGDGKIVIAGGTEVTYGVGKHAVTRQDLLVLRLNPNGSLDTTFNGSGEAILDIPAKGNIAACGLAILSTRQIVVGGSTMNQTGFLAARWNANGTIDTTFGPNGQGYVTTSTGQALLLDANEMALDGSGNILLVGGDTAAGIQYPAVVRFTAAGFPDATFGNNGEVLLNPPSPSETWAFGVGVQSTGQIVVCANFDNPVGGVCRLNANGTLDTTFGSGGYFILPTDAVALALTVQPDDKILLAGGTPAGGTKAFTVDRVLADGSSLDTAFGSGGEAAATFSNYGAGALAIALGPDGKITVTGEVSVSPSLGEPGMARFLNDITTNTAMTTANTTASPTAAMAASPVAPANGPSSLALAPLVLDSPDLVDALHLLSKRRGTH
ncbi:MAG: hypothetical protein ACHRXM_33875 [Isosphaerales bacterium]